jgi:FKBP-type peptidyl-prolyl cis-trans isomerase FkpA
MQNTKTLHTIFTGSLIVVLLGSLTLLGSACTKKGAETTATDTSTTGAQPTDTGATTTMATTTATELKIETLKPGTGAEAVQGKMVSVHYTGTLTDGKQFDSSVGKAPFEFQLGAGQVIQGWEKGVVGMKVGEKRKLTIPSELGYGAAGAGNVIPPNATLIFEVELLNVK